MSKVAFEIDPAKSAAYITVAENLDNQTIQDLTRAIDIVGDDNLVKAVVIRRLGPNFWSEADEAVCSFAHNLPKIKNLLWGPLSLMGMMADCKRVIVTEVQGQCVGIGLAITTISDITVAEKNAEFRFITGKAEVILPDPVHLVRCIGLGRTRVWAFDGQPWSAAEAKQNGLINSVVPKNGMKAAIDDAVTDISLMPLDGIYVGKSHLEAVMNSMGAPVGFGLTMFASASTPGGK
jgi:enoyl-CoA hydratase/carnithine racemase